MRSICLYNPQLIKASRFVSPVWRRCSEGSPVSVQINRTWSGVPLPMLGVLFYTTPKPATDLRIGEATLSILPTAFQSCLAPSAAQYWRLSRPTVGRQAKRKYNAGGQYILPAPMGHVIFRMRNIYRYVYKYMCISPP